MKSFIVLICLISLSAMAQSSNVTGVYENSKNSGPNGFDAYQTAQIGYTYNGKLDISFGYDKDYKVKVTEKNANSISFFGGEYEDQCDDPGCCDMMEISGKITNIDSATPVIEAEYVLNCPFPDDYDAPEGLVVVERSLPKVKNLD